MAILGLDGEYIVGIKYFVPDDEKIEQAKQEQKAQVVQSVQSRLCSMTVADLVGMVQNSSVAASALQGFASYNGYGIDTLKSLMKPRSLESAISTAVRGLAAAARVAHPLQVEATQEVDLGLRENDFLELKLQEFLGILLPTYTITFTIRDKKLYKIFNKRARLELSFGKTESDLVTMNCTIFKVVTKDQEDGGIVTLSGYFYAPEFLTNENQISYNGTSYEILNQFVALHNMKLISNVEPDQFKDKMLWRASNSRPIEYVINLWKHSFIDKESQIAPCITASGDLLWTDLKTVRASQIPEIQYADRVHLKDNPFYDNFGISRGQRYVHNVKDASMTLLNLNDKASAISSNTKPTSAYTRVGKFGMLTPEMHENWFLAEILNFARLFATMKQTSWINPGVEWKRFKPTDIVKVTSIESADSGMYLVCGRCAYLHDRKFDTWIQVARDTFTPATGVDLKG